MGINIEILMSVSPDTSTVLLTSKIGHWLRQLWVSQKGTEHLENVKQLSV